MTLRERWEQAWRERHASAAEIYRSTTSLQRVVYPLFVIASVLLVAATVRGLPEYLLPTGIVWYVLGGVLWWSVAQRDQEHRPAREPEEVPAAPTADESVERLPVGTAGR